MHGYRAGGWNGGSIVGAVTDDRGHHGVDSLTVAVTKHLADRLRNVVQLEDARAAGVVNIMIYVSNAVGIFYDQSLQRGGLTASRVVDDSVAHLPGEVQPFAVSLQLFHHAKALLIMGEVRGIALLHSLLTRVTEGRVPEVMTQSNGLAKVLVEAKRAADDTRDLRHLKRVRQARAVMRIIGCKKDLRFSHETAEGFGMNDSVAVSLKFGAVVTWGVRIFASLRVFRQTGIGRERFAFAIQKQLTNV